jgi:MoaA/NifB/PqqE/SkfB family radical SAM enzyme
MPLQKFFCYPELLQAFGESRRVFPISVEIDVTDQCNLNCNYCYWKAEKNASVNAMSLTDGEKILEKLKSCGVRSIVWSGGGEPLVNPAFLQLLQKAHDLGFAGGLFTNGTLLYQIDIKWLKIFFSANSHLRGLFR